MEPYISTVYRASGSTRFTLPHKLVKYMGWNKVHTFKITPSDDNTLIIEPVEAVNPGINPLSKYAEQLQTTKS
jgi:hypothetical protein